MSPINAILKQAFKTFNASAGLYRSNLTVLTNLLGQLEAKDLNLNSEFMEESFWEQPNKAPINYISICENNNFTVGIFILKPRGQIPLHNHPEMHGVIKMLLGKVKMTSFSLGTENTNLIDGNAVNMNFLKSKHKTIITAELVSANILDIKSHPCVLDPKRKNLHKIENIIDKPAAFLDILAPPYMTVIPSIGKRECAYYNILSQATKTVFRLHEIKSPSWYWCDISPYTGPTIDPLYLSKSQIKHKNIKQVPI